MSCVAFVKLNNQVDPQDSAAIEGEKLVEDSAAVIQGTKAKVLGKKVVGEGVFCGQQRECDR